MREKKNSIVAINGREYDAITGLPMVNRAEQTAPAEPAAPEPQPQQLAPAPPSEPSQPNAQASAPVKQSRPASIPGSPARVMSDIVPAKTGPKAASAPPTALFTPARLVKRPAPVSRLKAPHHVSQQVHHTPQRSQTLNRYATKKPELTQATGRSPMITRFATHPKPLQKPVVSDQLSVVSQEEPAVSVNHDAQTANNRKQITDNGQLQAIAPPKPVPVTKPEETQPPAQLSSRALKEQLIKERLAEVGNNQNAENTSGFSFGKLLNTLRKPRAVHITAAALAVLILGGYFAYINMPNLSVRIAASHAGVNASYPEYKPDGYAFNGPVSYAPGEVLLEFASNTNDQAYSISQRSSNWDSQAVLDNFVTQKSDSYLTYSEQGLTIYTFDNQAAWVNKGVLYTIDGNAPLSSGQILQIAASL